MDGDSGRILVTVRLWVPLDLRAAYLACMEDLKAAAGGDLVGVELGEDVTHDGFFFESYLFSGLASWSAVREGADPRLSPLFQRRRALVPSEAEERLVFRVLR